VQYAGAGRAFRARRLVAQARDSARAHAAAPSGRQWRARAHAPHLEGGSHPACARDGGAAAAGVRPFPGRLQRGAAARGAGQPSSRCALSPLGATAAPTLAGDGLSGGLRAQARLASGADPLAPAAVLRERDPTPPGGGTEERGERVLGTLFRPRAPGRTGRRRERLETSRSLAQASPRPPLTCYPCGRSKMLPMCRAVPAHARSSGVEGKGGRASPAHARSSRGQGRGAVHRHRSPPFGYHGTMPRENSAGQEKTLRLSNVWRESRELLAAHRGPLAIGFILMVVNRLTGLVLPASSKFAIDNVLAENRADLLLPLALVVAAATLVQAATGFALAQVVSIAGQRAIANMRRAVQAHVLRLPVRYYDSTKTGVLVSRVMTDAEGIRNLVGTGIVQLVGGLFTAVIALGIL